MINSLNIIQKLSEMSTKSHYPIKTGQVIPISKLNSKIHRRSEIWPVCCSLLATTTSRDEVCKVSELPAGHTM